MAIDRTTKGALLTLAVATMWGVSGAIAGGVFDVVSPARVTQSRALIAVVLLAPYAAHRGVLRLDGGFWKFALLGLNLAIPGATIQFLAPILVLGWIAVVHKTRVRALVWLAAVAAVIGVGLVTQAWMLEASDAWGIASGLTSAAAFAVYLLYGEYLGKTYKPAQIAAWGFVFAAALWLIVLPIWTFPTDIGAAAWRDLLIIGTLGTAVPFIVEFAALRLASSGVVGVVATAEPAIAAIAAAIMLGQALEPVQWLGVAVVVAAVATVQHLGLTDTHPTSPIV